MTTQCQCQHPKPQPLGSWTPPVLVCGSCGGNLTARTPKVFPAGTPATCNRCNRVSPLPRPMEGRPEANRTGVYRLLIIACLECGHVDGHWINEPA